MSKEKDYKGAVNKTGSEATPQGMVDKVLGKKPLGLDKVLNVKKDI